MQAYTKRRLVKDFAVIIGIILLPLIVYIHLLFPKDTDKVETIFFTLKSGYFDSVQIMIYYGSLKLLHVLTFLLWRFTIRNWWRNVLLLPVLFFTWQIWLIFDVDNHEFTSKNDLVIIVILLIVLFFILLNLGKKFKTFLKYKHIYNEVNEEIDKLIHQAASIQKAEIKDIENELRQLDSHKTSLTQELYLKQLMILKAKLEF